MLIYIFVYAWLYYASDIYLSIVYAPKNKHPQQALAFVH